MDEQDETCGTCGCTVGGGCPESTAEERAAYVIRHPDDHTIEEVQDACDLFDS